jgi:hypothetical protein
MLAVKGVYTGERTVQLERVAPLQEGYEVIVTFVSPPKKAEANDVAGEEKDLAERQAAYQRLLKYSGTLDRHIDYKKELMEYLDERYENTNWYKYPF